MQVQAQTNNNDKEGVPTNIEIENDVQVVTPPRTIQIQTSALLIVHQTPFPTTSTATIQALAEIFLNCIDHHFFQGLEMSLNSYFNVVFATEGDIFKSCSLEWVLMRKLIVEGVDTDFAPTRSLHVTNFLKMRKLEKIQKKEN